MIAVHENFAYLNWGITNEKLNIGTLSQNIIGTNRAFKSQTRNDVKNAKLVFALKAVSFDKFNAQQIPLFQLEKKIAFQKEGKDYSEWKRIRTFRLSASKRVDFVVISVKSLVRHYLNVGRYL